MPRASLILLLIVAGPALAAEDRAASRAVNYVFASELGSGVYEMSGRSLQVYRFMPEWVLREPQLRQPGLKFVLPVTFGFLDFNPVDVVEGDLPNRIDSFSITPAVQIEYVLRDDWHLIPFLNAGASFTSGGLDGLLYGAGVRLQHRATIHGAELETRHELTFAGVSWQGSLPNDQFLRLRQAALLKRGLGWHVGQRELEGSVYGIVDLLLDAPTPPIAGADHQLLQLEFGIAMGLRPPPTIWRFDAPHLGIGYRFAGDFSGWRLVIGRAF